MKNMYNKRWLEISLELLTNNLKDLIDWSINNGDKFNKEIYEIEKLIERIRSENN